MRKRVMRAIRQHFDLKYIIPGDFRNLFNFERTQRDLSPNDIDRGEFPVNMFL
jgi:hypothetical protein